MSATMNTNHPTTKVNQSDGSDTKSDACTEEFIFGTNGYKKLNKLCDTLQGELVKAKQLSSGQYVVIKQTEKSLLKERVAVENEMMLCVSENIIREALILQHLTISNHCIGGYIIQFIDYFESDTAHYLVLEYVETETNLKQFIQSAHRYIANGTLKLKNYKKAIKYLCWQLAVTIEWLHNAMSCCHLDICCENIMLQNCDFVQKNGSLTINPKLSIKLVDFGVAEIFVPKANGSTFQCNKQGLSLDNEAYLAPNVFANELYDASSADMWSLGIVLFECLTGKRLYSAMDVYHYLCTSYDPSTYKTPPRNNGYCALNDNTLRQYLTTNRNYTMYLPVIPMQLLTALLTITESERLNARSVLKHEWFRQYFEAYHNQIETKAISQKKRQLTQEVKMTRFPFYKLCGR